MPKKLFNLIFIGPPGGGKGTEIQLLQKKKYYKISTGDLLRKEISEETKLGKSIKKDMDSGNLIKDSIVTKLLDSAIGEHENGGLIFDGYPRNLKQAKTLERLLKKHDLEIDAVIHLETSDKVIIKRITGRYVCKNCGATYNKNGVQPKKEGICDVCKGTVFTVRSDDKIAVVKKRLQDYHKEAEQLLEYYGKKELVYTVSGESGDQMDTHKEVLGVFRQLRKMQKQ